MEQEPLPKRVDVSCALRRLEKQKLGKIGEILSLWAKAVSQEENAIHG